MDALVNFRDLGGKQTADGREVVSGKFFRSGEVVGLPNGTSEKLVTEYRLQTIVDFRGESEVKMRPDDTLNGVKYINIDISKDIDGATGSLQSMIHQDFSADAAMMTLYEQFVYNATAKNGLKSFLEISVSDDDIPLLFHCFAGKDRTGIAAALILASMDVSRDQIYEDYLVTNTLRKPANDQMLAMFKAEGYEDHQLVEIMKMLYVKKDYLARTFELMDLEFGGIKEFIRSKDGLGMPASYFETMVSLYTE
ncbi:tyrosine-protein phosphatase [Vagococcus acidifermentans]|uniref:Tyrosine specific protein phosphatases domain-containing protein n=1 Tax=Vagococcus acidifermentans TaxID=564710 RepID=A0A430B0R3_9ENTE|nr:tyrosine-protein phosphatase [Vagococcus acidifermentans]RSU13812.1 hypothetical protein CBF27_02625 [Vagococcus acidifermentans]